jgi:hypothetical protein
LHEQITKERDVNNFLKKHRAWLSKLKQSKSRQREETEEVAQHGNRVVFMIDHSAGFCDA